MRFLRKKQVIAKVGLSGMQIDRLERAGKFPKRIQLGPQSVAWVEEEVEARMEEMAENRGPLPAPMRTRAA